MSKRLSMPPRRWLLLLLLTLILPGCAPETPPAVIVKDSSCRVFRSLSWTVADSKETITLIRSHNAKLWSLCGRKKSS